MGKLTDLDIRNWMRSGERFEQRGDGDGVYLCFPARFAVPVWKLRYRFAGKPRTVNLGSYRDLSIAGARKTAKELRARVALGYDVAGEKQERKREAGVLRGTPVASTQRRKGAKAQNSGGMGRARGGRRHTVGSPAVSPQRRRGHRGGRLGVSDGGRRALLRGGITCR